jgi:hypothetical protein
MRAAAIVLATAATIGQARAEPPDPRPRPELSAVVVAGFGRSYSLGDGRVANLAPPTAEVRLGLRRACAPWAVPEVALGLIAFPETVPALGLGLRVHPFTSVPFARHSFVRGGVAGLVALDGFDLAVVVESGVAVTHQRVVGWLGIGADRFLVDPRVVAQLRVGVGVTF